MCICIDKEALTKLLVNPPIKKIDLRFPLGLEVTARNLKGVTIKDALDAIHKQFKKKVGVQIPPHVLYLRKNRIEKLTSSLPSIRPTTSSRIPTLQDSNGTVKNAIQNSSCTRKRQARHP